MSEVKRVKIQDIIGSQIPDFIESESPLFKEFLSQYYLLNESQTGIDDIVINLSKYKSIDSFNEETFYIEKNPCILTSEISSFDSTIEVNHTIGFPEKYGLLKIDNEIITYTGITTNSFTGCIRGFSGLSKENNNDVFVFTSSDSSSHSNKSTVLNLNFQFFQEFFKKFKSQFLVGFEDRNFDEKLNYKEFLSKAKDFYSAKGTDISFEILFKVLFGTNVNVVNPQEYLFTPSSNNYVKTKNILVEKIKGEENILSIKGKTLYQKDVQGRIVIASIYNVEYRPDQGKEFFEIYLDPESFVYDFVSTKNTSIVENVSYGSTTLYVDSTSGFPDTGSLIINSKLLPETITLNYTDRTLNQFIGISPINYNLYFGDEVIENNLAYSYLDDGTKVEFRICNNISSLDAVETFGLRVNDKVNLSSIGKDFNYDPVVKNWNYNIPSNIVGIKKVSSSNFSGILTTFPSEIQNVYVDERNKDYYISASGFPKYTFSADNASFSVSPSIIGSGSTTIFNTSKNHNLLTGDKIYYIGSSLSGIQTGTYYVTKIADNKISLSFSNFDVFYGKYILGNDNNYIDSAIKYGYHDETTKSIKQLLNQNIFKKISIIKDKKNQSSLEKGKTINKKIGILRNGVEICSPSFFNQSIYYGKIESIDVVSAGSDYDVINFPKLIIKDEDNYTAKAHVNIVGSLKEIKIIDPGIGYQSIPKITLTGGNGSGAIIESTLKKQQIEAFFSGDYTGVGLYPNNTITFLKPHGFSNGEEVIYDSNYNDEIEPFVNNSRYFVSYISNTTVGIHSRQSDAFSGINTVNINSYGDGSHIFRSYENKYVIDNAYVVDGGNGYSNRYVTVKSPLPNSNFDPTGYTLVGNAGINVYDNYIFAKNHNFSDLDIIDYSTTGSAISGLSTSNQYYVTVIDEDKFTLYEVESSTNPTKNYYDKKYVNIAGVGTGTHTFSYPPISLNIESLSGTGFTTLIKPILTPIVLGSIEDVYLEEQGTGYGSGDVINFNNSPIIEFEKPTQLAVLRPKIANGEIIDVEILNHGKNYSNDIDIIISGDGKFADVFPIVENGEIIRVDILNSGVGYKEKTTELTITKRGSGAKFYGNITEWTINQVIKNNNTIAPIADGEGMLVPSDNSAFGLQYINFYPPSIFRNDLADNGIKHSPIIGWAYDGNPIYGPYGYVNANGSGGITRMISGYNQLDITNLISSKLRPISYLQGFFIQDYQYQYDPDKHLDEYNGRYCITPEFPNGVYAYFYSTDIIQNTLKPKYPYLVGNFFKDESNDYNYNVLNNQKTVDLNSLDLTRNIGTYDLQNYDIFTKLTSKNKEDYIVKSVVSSGISSVVINYSGDNYKVNDKVVFDNSNTNGSGSDAFISRVYGKKITQAQIGVTTYYNVNFANSNNNLIGILSTYSYINDSDNIVISAISSSPYSYIDGNKTVSIFNNQTKLSQNLQNQSVTGVSTYILVNQVSGFNVDDYIKIENEILRITNISIEQSLLFVNRFDSFVGIHSIGTVVELLPRKFIIKGIDASELQTFENKRVYFNPEETIGIGTIGSIYNKIIGINTANGEISYLEKYSIGINTTLIKLGDIITGQYVSTGTTVTSIGINSIGIGVSHTFNSLGISTNVYKISRSIYNKSIPPKSIYIPNHNFYTGQPLKYNSGLNGQELVVSQVGYGSTFSIKNNQIVYAINNGLDFIGISTVGFTSSVGIGSTLNSLYFSDLSASNVGKSHYLETTYPTLTGTVEKYSIDITTNENHNLTSGDSIKFNYFPTLDEEVTFSYDNTIRKITTGLVEFDTSSDVNVSTSEITIFNNNFNTGDKIVYYNDGNSTIGGLENNKTYYIIKEDSFNIKFANYYADALTGNSIKLSSTGSGIQKIALINPTIKVTRGNTLKINLNQISQMELRLYEDLNFTKEIPKINYIDVFGNYQLDTNKITSNEIYYQFVSYINSSLNEKQVSSDYEVFGRNKISIENNTFNQKNFNITTSDEKSFSVGLKYKPKFLTINNVGDISYDTDSKSAFGPISKIKINFQGTGYKRIPKIKEIISGIGSGAVLTAISDQIGKIDFLEKNRSSYDFPSDNTLIPFISIPAVCKIDQISRIDYIKIINSGSGYNTPPTLKVLGRDDIILSTKLKNNSVSSVTISKNANNLSTPLEIISVKNSNGYDIDNIVVGYSGTTITLELINNVQEYPLITTGYGTTEIVFPFSVGDKIFIENCRVIPNSGKNYNSENYDYKFFTVTGIDKDNFKLTYSSVGLSTNFGQYYTNFGYGYVCNYKDIAKFEMKLIDDLSYKSGELVTSGNFSATVMENGWDNDINELRLNNCTGVLSVGDNLYGTESLLNGKVALVNSFTLKPKMGPYKDKITKNSLDKGLLNDYLIRIADNDYYQKFSYAISGEIPYLDWKNAVRSLVHPSGFKEFSDLNIVSKPIVKSTSKIPKKSNLSPGTSQSSLDFTIDIDSIKSFYSRDNFTFVTEANEYEDGSIQNIVIGSQSANVVGLGETAVTGIPLKSYILNKSNKVFKLDDISDQFTGITSSIGGNIVGLTSFKLKTNGLSAFQRIFNSSNALTVNISNDSLNILNHNLQTGQKLYYNSYNGTPIGIKTTSLTEGSAIFRNNSGYLSVVDPLTCNIITSVGSGVGSAVYENGYNIPVFGVTGIGSTAAVGSFLGIYGTGYPYIPSTSSGLGTGAKFSVIFTYDVLTGQPLSTSVILRDGGSNYNIGDTISIAGTYLNGSTPANNLSFTITTLSSTKVVGAANSVFTNVSGISVTGIGSGALFNVSRDSNGSIKSTEVVNGGVGYALTDSIKILGTDIGGSTPNDDYLVSPTELGTNKLPSIVYVNKLNDNIISLSGLSNQISNSQFDLISLGVGNHSLTVDNPNASSLISIDNIIQSPIYIRDISVSLSESVGIGSTLIYLSSGISSITTLDSLQIENEYLKIKSVGAIGTSILEVDRGFFGSISTSHLVGSAVTVVRGDYNIIGDVIYFSTPPYGPTGPYGSQIKSSFQGRVFSRSFDSLNAPDDKNIILDDISKDFTGISATSFVLKSNKNKVVGLFTGTNGGGVNINNNPIILINNVSQIPGINYDIDTVSNNTIRFIGGVPKAGKIVRVGLTTGFGYQPLVGASATVSVSAAGTISNVYINGPGSGYRDLPYVSVASTQGSGAIFTPSIGAGGTISLTITNAGSGYTSTSLPKITISDPIAYSDLPLEYSSGYSGLGTGAKASVVIGFGSSVINFTLESPGISYKVGDVLKVSGIVTNPNIGTSFSEFKVTVQEILTDKFNGFYPGQFIQFENISDYFNGVRRSFRLYYKDTSGITNSISLKTISGYDFNLNNNLIVYLNDILQEPEISYQFNGSKIIFTEPPKINSKCNILFYRGSDLDVEQIDPPKTFKEGDIVQIKENQNNLFDVSQLERVIKNINSSDNFDTFTYSSVGIDTNVNNARPLLWTKQTKDTIINGVLYSKSRPSLKSRIIPTTSIIKNVSKIDSEIYVINCFPLFKKVDNLSEFLVDAIICDNKTISSGFGTAYVSFASTISNVVLSNNGNGYEITVSPVISIPSPTKSKDPIKNWSNSSGISTDKTFNFIAISDIIVSIGNSDTLGLSTDAITWTQLPVPTTNIDYKSVEIISNSNYIFVGSNGKIISAVGSGVTISNWQEKTKLKVTNQIGDIQYENSDYNGSLNSVSYLPINDTISIVGTSGTIFYAQGFNSPYFLENKITNYNLNSITNNGSIFVTVGDSGYIGVSTNSIIWTQSGIDVTNYNLNKVIWKNGKFIAVGNNATILQSQNGLSWSKLPDSNISVNLINLDYYGNDLYVSLSDNGELYYSFNLINWEKRLTNQTNELKDLKFIDYVGSEGRFVGVGSLGTIIYSEPVKNRAEAYGNVSAGVITSVTITNGGFGYTNDVQVLVESEKTKEEKLISIKAKGDYGTIIGINTFAIGTYGLGHTTAPKVEFVLKSDNYVGTAYSGLNQYKNENEEFITFSQIQKGDYFTIFNTNTVCGHAVTGISTDLGGLSNYPLSKIGTGGTATDGNYGIDGVYRAEYVVANPASGIVTVTCHLYPKNYFLNLDTFEYVGYVNLVVGVSSINEYGNYSWGKIYGFQNRQRQDPKDFIVNSDNGIIGLSTGPEVYRTRELI